jgi:hypothetical protein
MLRKPFPLGVLLQRIEYLGWIYVVDDEHIELLGNKHGIYDCIIKTLLTADDIQPQVFPALALSRCISCTTLPS